MSDSIITQCPNCSTTFRVSDEVLNMAKGKVRCGQCFHIFAAEPHESNNVNSELKRTPITDNTNKQITNVASSPKIVIEPPSPPKWLNSLVENDTDEQEALTPYQQRVLSERKLLQIAEHNKEAEPLQDDEEELVEKAPWEIELAKLEAMQSTDTQKTPSIKPKQNKVAETTPTNQQTAPQTQIKNTPDNTIEQPEYMQALQQLAQSNSHDSTAKHAEYKKDAQQKLSELIEETPKPQQSQKTDVKRHTLFWFTTSTIAVIAIFAQLLHFNFETGSRSTSLRPIYKVVCTYSGCLLPIFEDVSSIDIQYVRVQSHPTQSNSLLVNAIMTNTSPFSQPMPKLALEFFDLNGNPIAARLFSQNNFLDKDFLDITYMPPNTPIHLVISIVDPGAAAVTHQLTAYKSNTRSF